LYRSKRRWLIRALGWVIGGFASVVAVLLLALAAYLLFTDYPEKLRSTLESELANLAGAPAKIRSISLDLPHYAFALEGVSVGAPGHSGPVLELESVWGRLRLSEVLNLRLQWSELVVNGLTLHLLENADEGLSLTTRRAESGPLARVGMAADHVSIQRAVIVIENEKVPWELEASNLSLDLTRVGAELYHGKLAYDDGRLRIKDHEEVRASVEADFELVPHELLLKEARVQSDIGQLLATGKLAFAGGARGRFDVTAEGEVGRTIESLFGLREAEGLAKGTATFRGSLAVEPGNKTLAGTLLLPQGNVAGIPLTHWKAEVFWDRSLLQVSYAQGTIAGGAARLQLHQPLPVHEHLASLDVDFERASLAGILRESRGLASPVDSLLGGRVSLSFSAVAPGELQGQFEIAGQAPPSEHRMGAPVPLSLRAKGTLSGAGLVLDDADLETPFLKGAVSGTYPRKGLARLVVDFQSSKLEDLDRLQRDIRRLFVGESKDQGPRPELLGIGGSGEARGIVTGKLPDLSFDGELAADRLRLASIDLGAVRSRLSIAGERLGLGDLAAHIGDGALAGRADMSIEGSLRDRDFDLDLTLSRWPVEELSRVLGAPVSLDGSASGRIVARRSRTRLDGGASLELENGRIAGVVFDRGEARLGLDGATIRVDPFTLVRDGASAKGRLEINLENRLLGGSISTRALELGSLGLDGALSGTVEGQFDLSGRIESPQGSLSGRGRNIRLKGVELGEAFVTGNLRGDDLDLRVSLERQAAEIVAEGSVRLAEDYPARAQVRWHGLDTAAWMGIPSEAAGGLTALSDGVGTVRVPLKAADLLAAARGEGEVSQFVLEGENYRIASVAPIRVHLENARLALDEAELAEGKSRLTIGGSMDLASDSLDLKAEGVVSLGVLQSLYPGLSAIGETTLSAAVTGSRERPSLTGYADLKDSSVRLEGFRQALGGLTGRLVFDNRTVRVSDLHGVFGSGPVTISGTVGLEGIQPSTFDLTARGSGVRLRYPEGLVATLEGDLSLLGSADERMVSGALVLRDAVWSREYDLVSGMLADREGLDLFPDLTESEALKDVRLDVSIRAPGSLKVRNGLAVLEASADLELRGTLGHPVLLGQAEAQHGEIYFMGQRYNISRGKVDFVDPTKVEPFVDLTAETRVRSYNVQLRLTGTPQRFYPELTSDPPLRTVDILRLLAGANERDILVGTEEEEIAGVGVASLLTERLSQEVGKRAERLFGLDRFSIDPFLIGQFSDPTARVSLGKQITRQLSINYSTNLNQTTEAIILIEYTPDGPMSWVLSRDEEGHVGIDVRFRKSF
jgi:TamB, inner membrane protein subunit of TAM complex